MGNDILYLTKLWRYQMRKNISYRTYVKQMAIVSMCAAIIVISAWIAIPFTVSFTLQTLAIFVISALFELRISLLSVTLYTALGLCGLPVFSGFSSGPSAIIGPTGGFIIGFLFIPPIIRAFHAKSKRMLALSMVISLLICYTVGTVWFIALYGSFSLPDILNALTVCVLPFILPDIAKIALAVLLSSRLKTIIKI